MTLVRINPNGPLGSRIASTLVGRPLFASDGDSFEMTPDAATAAWDTVEELRLAFVIDEIDARDTHYVDGPCFDEGCTRRHVQLEQPENRWLTGAQHADGRCPECGAGPYCIVCGRGYANEREERLARIALVYPEAAAEARLAGRKENHDGS